MVFNPDDPEEHARSVASSTKPAFALTAPAAGSDPSTATPSPATPVEAPAEAPAEVGSQTASQTATKRGRNGAQPARAGRRRGKPTPSTPEPGSEPASASQASGSDGDGDSEPGEPSEVGESDSDKKDSKIAEVAAAGSRLPPAPKDEDRVLAKEIWLENIEKTLRPQSTTDSYLFLILNELRVLNLKVERLHDALSRNRFPSPEEIAYGFRAAVYLETGADLPPLESERVAAVAQGQKPSGRTPFDDSSDHRGSQGSKGSYGDNEETDPRKASIKEAIAKAYPDGKSCPDCARPMVVRFARSGKNEGNPFWGCKGYYDKENPCSKIVGISLAKLESMMSTPNSESSKSEAGDGNQQQSADEKCNAF